MTTIERLATVAFSLIVGLGLVAVGEFVSWIVAGGGLALGLVILVMLTFESSPSESVPDRTPNEEAMAADGNVQATGIGGLRVVDRDEIARRAAASRETDLDEE